MEGFELIARYQKYAIFAPCKFFNLWISRKVGKITILTRAYLYQYSLLQEAIAVARLRKQLLQVTGNVHFYKSGDDYVVCRSEGLMRRKSLDDDIADDNTSM
jgi:hypothetical protein